MKKHSNVFTLMLLAIGTAIGLIIIMAVSINTNKVGTYGYGATDLVGASPEQVGEFAQQYVEAQHGTTKSKSQVLLARPIEGDELPALELGCPLSFAAIETPPLMLVILKGEFKLNTPGVAGTRTEANYLAYIFDLWSARPVYLRASKTGGHFRKALNDTTLPLETQGIALACPTEVPYPKTLHYGDSVPGLTPPTASSSVTALATPTILIPSPVPTSQIR